jgi:hypothetical protein
MNTQTALPADQDALTPPARLARKLVIDLSVMAVIGIVLAVLGPFGSSAMPFANRLAYWTLFSLAGYFCYQPVGYAVVRLGPRLQLPLWFLWAAAVFLATIPMAIFVWLVNSYPGPMRMPPLDVAVQHYFAVLVIGTLVTLFFNLLPVTRSDGGPRSDPAPANQAVAPEPSLPGAQVRFLDRLPPHLGTDLIALEMEDHYVRAHTVLGSELILLRLRDAIAELDGIEGVQVHRSWWVARHAVEDVQRDGRNLRLILPGGLVAPVARANAATLKQLGWI